jgi:hypothetical protein
MEFWSLVLAVALLCSLPAGLVLLGVLAHRPSSASWIQSHARLFAVVAASAWASLALRNWLGSSEPSVFGVLVPVVGLISLVAFSIARADRGAARS